MFWDETVRQVDADLRGGRHAGLPHRLLSSAVDGRVKVGSPLNDPTMSRVGMWVGIAAVFVYGFLGFGLAVTGQL